MLTRSTGSSTTGCANAPTSTSLRCRCSRASRGSRSTSTGPRREAFARSELEASEFDVLSALRRAGAPYRLSPKQLLQQTLVSSGTMTNRIDRLVERGLVSRQTDPNDGRGILVEMTSGRADAGRRRDHASRRRRVGAAAQPAGGRAETARRPAAQAEPRVRLRLGTGHRRRSSSRRSRAYRNPEIVHIHTSSIEHTFDSGRLDA